MTLSLEMLGLLAPALIAGLIVASTHVPLGQEVLKRGIIFIDLAIAQIAALGVVFALVIFHAQDTILSVLSALLFALVAGGLFAWLEKKSPKHLEALIGSAFVLSASLAILLLANDPHGGEHMQDMLAGQILWVDWQQLIMTALIYAALLGAWFGFKERRGKLFYLIFPIAITLSVQLVGVYLVFASLIIPALGTVKFEGTKRLWAGYAIAALSFTAGLIVSTWYDLPSGPVIVCCYPLFARLLSKLKKN
jgi:zinc/manganese transport system permease protein